MPFAMVLLSAVLSGAEAAPAGLPAEREALAALDAAHRRLVRTATRACVSAHATGGQRIAGPEDFACVVSGVEAAVGASEDATLQAFHAALPFFARYDQDRSPAVAHGLGR